MLADDYVYFAAAAACRYNALQHLRADAYAYYAGLYALPPRASHVVRYASYHYLTRFADFYDMLRYGIYFSSLQRFRYYPC